MTRTIIAMLIIATILGCTGCKEKEPVSADEWMSLQTQIGVLTSQIKALDEKIDALRNQPPTVRAPDTEAAFVSATESGYGLARTKLGPMTVSLSGAEKYVDGYKLRLQLGNITAAQLSGVHVNVAWGLFKVGTAQKTKDFEILKPLPPGTFTTTEILLSPADATEIKLVSVSVVPDKIELRNN